MTPTGSIRLHGRGASLRLVLLAAAALTGLVTTAGYGAETKTPASVDPQARSQTTDHYVAGKYDKTGVYVPPHYQAAPKPRFHGYFFNKHEAGDPAQKPN